MTNPTNHRYRKRFFEIIEVFSKYGMAYIFKRFRNKKKHPFDRGERIRNILEELGPTFIKFGQMLSTRNDLLPNDIIQELVKLQDEVPADPFSYIFKETLKSDKYFLEKFEYINKNPIGSASIAQVYKAKLENGEDVVIKVRRPGIKEIVMEDIEVLKHIANIVQYLPQFRDINLNSIVEEFGKSMFMEMDFIKEIVSMKKFNDLFRNNDHIYAPFPYEELSSDNIIVMQFIKGDKFTDVLRNNIERNYSLKEKEELLFWGADSLYQQAFTIGFLHSDPHPGNLIISPDRKLYFVDFGQVTYIDKHTRRTLLELLISITRRDPEMLATIIIDNFYCKDEDGLTEDIKIMFSRYYGKPLADFSMSQMFFEIFEIIRKRKVTVPPQLLLLSKMILLLESNAKKLKGDFNAIEFTEEFFKQRWLSILFDRVQEIKEESVWDFLLLSRNTRNVKKIFDSGRIKLEIEVPKVEKIMMALKFAMNSLAVSIIIAALLISINNFENQILAYIGVTILGLFVIYEFISEGRK